MAVNKRVFAIHYEDIVSEASIDCAVTRTLRDLLINQLPLLLSAASASQSSSMLLTHASQASIFVDNCLLCSFGGQRLSLGTLTEVAPTTLHVTTRASRGSGGGGGGSGGGGGCAIKAESSGRGSLLKRKRSSSAVRRENDDDNNDDATSLDYHNSTCSSNNYNYRNESERETSELRNRFYMRRELTPGTSSSSAGGNGDDYDDVDVDNDRVIYDCDKSYSEYKEEDVGYDNENDDAFGLCRKSIATRPGLVVCGDGNYVEADYIEGYGKDGRQQCAVLPCIVGGVVRLINLESRDKSHQWTVYIRGLFNETDYLAQCIESVLFILDPSFTPNERLVTSAPFELTEEGWGEFVVKMKVQLRHYPRTVQVMLSSSSFSEMMIEKSEVKMASMCLRTQTESTLTGLTRGPVLSPVISVLSKYDYYSHNDKSAAEASTGSFVCNNSGYCMVKKEVDVKDSAEGHGGSFKGNKVGAVCEGTQSTAAGQPATATLHVCPGVVVLSHLLRFSHRPRRPHCIPPLGRPYEPEEHIGYTIVQTPVVTEQYDEIVVPDPPAALFEVAAALPDMLVRRIAAAKLARVMTQQQQQRMFAVGASSSAEQTTAVFNEDGVSCWKYIVQEEPEDAVFAESYLESVSATQFVLSARHNFSTGKSTAAAQQQQRKQQAQKLPYVVDPTVVVKVSRGRRKLAGAEFDLAALKTAKKGLEDAIDKMRREITVRQAAHIYHQYT